VAALGRDPETMGIVWQQPCVVAETEREALAQRERLLTAIPPEGVGVYLSHNAGYDFSTLPQRFTLGELHRAIIDSQASPAGFVRELVAQRGGHRDHAGGILRPRQAVCHQLRAHGGRNRGAGRRPSGGSIRGNRQPRWVHAGPCRVDAGDLAAIVELLVPELQRRGRFRREYRGRTLRENRFDE
jgi:hypothetical protein